ncbi:MurT ligase domain-containing protein [Effusibacillus lacus]|uniref:Lipid II isoglutaminyl synthase (glutamine-hydrolyzing) subunit MurT n=1 Tax=Effusibacillus lacus TaxID=1348429 RepID=A0A292YR20_9BACL|nr:MurT ligase domain-containing protein [Effusibacillus lacus]TCS68051.1 UDP-N-acetylmuramyl tripeptide synthase [Effusibacillus lacus]GAX90945.1 UDP-N-acetylmuramyl peptide synthase [Effusibacillus lacus]
MQTWRVWTAIYAAKITKRLLSLLGRKGTTLPGAVALRICPDLLNYYGKKLAGQVVLVTGTNGKTTTSNLLTNFLRKDGRNVVSNSLGANLIQGIAAALIEGVSGSGGKQSAVLEVDEATIAKVIQPLKPSAVIVTNFFRDQMDRYGEVDTVVNMVGDALQLSPAETTVILNADDPLVSSIAPDGKKVLYYGVQSSDIDMDEQGEVRDGKFCRKCGSTLHYSLYHYGQLGFFKCPVCDFQRRIPDQAAERVRLHEGGIRFDLDGSTGFLHSPAFYNVYNALAAITAAKVLGVKQQVVEREMQGLSTGLGRMERIVTNGNQDTMLALVKNPTGCNQVLRVVSQMEKPVDMVFILNDRYADGTDVSWIWDTHLERLREQKCLRRIVAAGTRAHDMAVRFKYAGLGDITTICEGDLEAVDRALGELPADHTLFILSTYTSLYAVRDHLLAKGRAAVEA